MPNFRDWLATEATTEYKPGPMDPALLTWDEFYGKVNAGGKTHDQQAYDWSLADMNKPDRSYMSHAEFPEPIFRKTFRGVPLEFRLHREDRYKESRFYKTDGNGGIVRIDGVDQFWTPEELKASGVRQYTHHIGVFNAERQCVGYSTDDEWGCVLTVVAREYRGLGFGTLLIKMAYEYAPGQPTGGVTSYGYKGLFRAYQMFVREYLQRGFYSHLVREKRMDAGRAKEIIASAKLGPARPPASDLGTDDPENWELYHEDGCFIIYDRKLRELAEGDTDETYHWVERAVKGLAYVGGGYNEHNLGILWRLGADTPQLKKYLLWCAVSWCHREQLPLRIHQERWADCDPTIVKIDKKTGLAELAGRPVDYDGPAAHERKWRRSFDRYDEFKSRMVELAYAKFGDD